MSRVTIKDVANHAGVSVATVSYVLNDVDGKNITESTRQKVLDSVRELNYIPNNAAKRLKTSQSKCIAVRLATTLSIPRYYLAIQGIRAYLEPLGYNIILFNEKKTGRSANYLDACLNTQADGIIYISANYTDIADDILDTIQTNHIPLSVIDCMSSNPDVNSINYDYYASSYMRVEYMLKKGITDFIYITPVHKNYKQLSRLRGFLALLDGVEGLTYRIVEYDVPDANFSEYNAANFDVSSELSSSLTAKIRDIYKQCIEEATPQTGIIDTFQDAHTFLAPHLYIQHALDKTGKTDNWYNRTASYDFPHYDVGYEAARSLIDTINGSTNVRKIVFQPKIVTIDPNLY